MDDWLRYAFTAIPGGANGLLLYQPGLRRRRRLRERGGRSAGDDQTAVGRGAAQTLRRAGGRLYAGGRVPGHDARKHPPDGPGPAPAPARLPPDPFLSPFALFKI